MRVLTGWLSAFLLHAHGRRHGALRQCQLGLAAAVCISILSHHSAGCDILMFSENIKISQPAEW
jgi:hypothetical protein